MQKRERMAVFSVGLVLLAIFTFTDLQISMVLFTKSLYGRFFEVVGELPFVFLTLFGCVLLFRFRSRKNLAANLGTGLLAVLPIALFAAMGGFMTLNYLSENIGPLPGFLAVAISLVLLAGACVLAMRVPARYARQAITYGIIALVYCVLVIVVMNTIKATWGRMRIREMTDPLTQFTPWYVITNRGGFDNVYASFPSGHSMNSAAIILSLLLPSILPGLRGRERVIKLVTYSWLLLVGSSRVVMGAHFASDVVVGIMLSLALFEATRFVIGRVRKDNLLEATVAG